MLKLLKHYGKKATLAFIFFALFITLNCGKRKPPLPPVEKVPQRVEVSGSQQGNKIILVWTMPNRNARKGDVLHISRADIYRLAEPLNSPLTLSEEDFSAKSTLISSVPITENDFGRKKLTFTDTLSFAGQPVRLRYAIRFVNDSGQKAGFSNFLLIEPASKVAEEPRGLQIQVTQESVNLSWLAPEANIDGSTPANIIGFNIYRSDGATKLTKRLNDKPVSGNVFEDKFFEFEKSYTYFLRAVSLGKDAEPIESLDSEALSVIPKDTFPPTPPSAITIAASPQTISIFFAFNPEKDVLGYRVYRSTDPALPKKDWTLMTPEILMTNTFQDTQVESGKTYFYFLTAIDKFGNVSAASEVVSETVP